MDCHKNEALRAKKVAETFWTSCNRCNVQFEYEKIYVNRNVLSRCCKQPFLAIEVPAPVVNSHGSCPWPFGPFPLQQQDMPISSSGPKSVSNIVKRTFEATSKGLKRRNEGLSRNDEARTKSSSTVPEKVEAAPVSAASAVSRSVKKLCRIKIRGMLQEKAKVELIAFVSRHESYLVISRQN